jgi:small ligand-binding sensory domain FIST
MRLTSVSAVGRDVGRLAEQAASQVLTKLGGRPDALLWLTDAASRPEEIAAAMADCCGASVGAVSREGLIGGGGEHSASPEESRVVALALSSLHDKCLARPFHSPPDGLPDLPTESWAAFAAASPADSPHLLLLASPPRDGAFAIERWLGRMDAALPWAKKIGGLTVGDGRLVQCGSNPRVAAAASISHGD